MKTTLISLFKSDASSAPLGIAYIAAVLKENGYDEVSIIDNNSMKNETEIETRIRKDMPDIVGVSIMTADLHTAEKIVYLIKKINKNIVIIAGGPHPTIMPEETLKNKNIDIVVVGEGEYTFVELVKSLENKKPLDDVKGIYYKVNKKIKKTVARPPIENLDKLPFPARDLLPMKYYLSNIPPYPMIMPMTQVIVVRGCPFNCSFCQSTGRKLFGSKVRFRSPDNVLDEIEYLIKKYRLGSIHLSGDTLTADKKWVYSFCDKLKERNLNINWNISTRVNMISREMLKKMAEAGCYFIQFGVESGSQRILDEILNKGIKVEQTKDCFKWCHEAGIIASANVMIGSPSETRSEILSTYELLKEIDPGFISTSITNPLPGTYLYDIAKSKNLIKTNDLAKFGRHSKGTMKREISDDEIERYIKLFWVLYEEKLIKNTLQLNKKKHFIKYSYKREASILKCNPGYFLKNLIQKPMTLMALIKYHILEYSETMKLIRNQSK